MGNQGCMLSFDNTIIKKQMFSPLPEEDFTSSPIEHGTILDGHPAATFYNISPLDLHCLLRRLNSPLMGPNGLELQTEFTVGDL